MLDILLITFKDGGWSNFTDFPCSVTCGIGVLVSTRACKNPAPQYGGLDCDGESTRFNKCEPGECIVGMKTFTTTETEKYYRKHVQ